ncbi:Ribulose-5-phosphate 4-epimerase/Fuculose-1-phosphate aldolase [Arboricoccus pini]|uniref:Ribulose-5-phosphate 4-epimerase/Fuculose-1-phosphate aldolase n=1 Tax=Arboricoccus pini TaxID=1963835 RepID=A0A212RJK6_9PROT|nr:class II aldolase and adducin N-terminal domain-containing protein [Arboricoccus pini]SNB72610.1 Ribulose-5-phosphate 4-epimerase/Fuculose-1-phosphate aldolase [Arboricoccus pini]
MSNILKHPSYTDEDAAVRQMRIDLAAAFRLIARAGWHEAVANHLSLAVSDDGQTFLINPRWRHFSRIKASDLLLLDARDSEAMKRPDAPDITAWNIHGAVHRQVPGARCILHVHSPYATALASLADPTIKPVDQNTCRFFNRVAYDMHYGGIADSSEEGNRIASMLGNRQTMMMANHGVLITASTVAEAFDLLYYMEKSCQNLMLAYSSGQPLHILSDEVAELTARGWEGKGAVAQAIVHFEEMKRILDEEDPSYAH